MKRDFVDQPACQTALTLYSCPWTWPGTSGLGPGNALPTEGRWLRPRPWQTTSDPKACSPGGLEHRVSPVCAVWRPRGRWAATSMDRFVTEAFPRLRAGKRTMPLSRPGLFTSLARGWNLLPAVAAADPQGYVRRPTKPGPKPRAALHCQCLECVKVCPYLEQLQGPIPRSTPAKYTTTNPLSLEARQSNKLVNSCSLCGLCETACARKISPCRSLCLQTRGGSMVQRGHMPPSAHEFALLDMDFSLGEQVSAWPGHEPGREFSSWAVLSGLPVVRGQPPDQVRRGVRTPLRQSPFPAGWPCCWAAAEPRLTGAAGKSCKSAECWIRVLAKGLERFGLSRKLITACSTCLLHVQGPTFRILSSVFACGRCCVETRPRQ